MGNLQCTVDDMFPLTSVAQDICPFQNYQFNDYLPNFILSDASVHLSRKYAAVQASLTPQQQQAFTQTLRSTFGREGKVAFGGTGVLALSLAILFDTVAKQVKGEYVSDHDPIPGLFLKDPKGYYAPAVYTSSKYLRLVPHIANNPARMRDETERYLKQLIIDDLAFVELLMQSKQDDITVMNRYIADFMQWPLHLQLQRLTNESFANRVVEFAIEYHEQMVKLNKTKGHKQPTLDLHHNVNFNLNCKPEKGSKQFLNEIKKSDQRTQDAFKKCQPKDMEDSKTWLCNFVQTVWLDVVRTPIYFTGKKHQLVNQREDFDLKIGALGKWAMQ